MLPLASLLTRASAVLVGLIVAAVCVGAAAAAMTEPERRGRMVEIGGGRGMGPRAADAVAGALARLIAASRERAPFLFVGHSAAGLYLRRFAGLNPQRV